MAHVLLVEDDADQRQIRRLILERHGHTVVEAATPEEALCAEAACAVLGCAVLGCAVMDLRMPRVEDGLGLIRAFHGREKRLPVVVLSGYVEDLTGRPEAQMVGAILKKPVKMEILLRTIQRLVCALALLMLLAAGAQAQQGNFTFNVTRAAEAAAELELTAPGGDWSAKGREASFAVVKLDGVEQQRICVWGGERKASYRVFLGELAPGRHELTVERDARFSAAGAALKIGEAKFTFAAQGEPGWRLLAHAPVLLARANTVGGFTDVPMLVYATEGRDADGEWIEYTVIFTNEDGGTSTRDLMARWGRTTDIEYVYRAWFDARGAVKKTLIQTKDHVDLPYEGVYLGRHPVLMPVTDNNMVAPAKPGDSPIRYQLQPVLADLSLGSRELVMDAEPLTYAVAAEEMRREGKLREYGRFDGEKISEPRNYLAIEMKLEVADTAVQALVQLKGEERWRGSAVGVGKDFIERGGWVRVALELPPGTRPADITGFAAECLSRRDLVRMPVPKHGWCTVAEVGKVFFLGSNGLVKVKLPAEGWKLETGELRTVRVK